MVCRLCQSENVAEKYKISKFSNPFLVYQCNNCGFMFQDTTPENAYAFYNEGYYRKEQEYSYIDEREKERFARYVWKKRFKILKRLEKTTDKVKNFLDVGCSFGGLMQVAKENGYEAYGVEVSEYATRFLRERFGADKIFTGSIEEVNLPEDSFSIVTMIEVIEHILNPVKAILNVYKSMKKGGVLLIQTANMAGLQAKIYGENYHYFLPGHISYFNHKNLKMLLEKVGFEKIKIYGGVEFGLLPKLLKSRGDFNSSLDYLKWIRISLYHLASKLRIGNIFFTSSMVIIARK
ncbi:MAG: class I SAM-dependent methyltransferase [Brevinematia bacterium]